MADGQKWSISYTDVFNKKTVESFDSKGEAQSRYEALIPRTYGDLGDLIEVTAPVQSALKVQESVKHTIDWDDFDTVVSRVLMNDSDNIRGEVYRSVRNGGDKSICTLDDDTPLFSISPDYSSDSRGDVYAYNENLDRATFRKVADRIRSLCIAAERALSGNYEYPIYAHVFASHDDMYKYLMDKDEDCGGASAASLGATPTGVVRPDDSSKKNEADGDDSELQAAYGDGDTYYGESSANGFYATEKHPMAWAILNNDVAELEALHNGTMKTPEEPWNCHGWSEDIDAPEDSDGNYPYVYNMDTDYKETFVEDMPDRVVGEKDNQPALRKALEYYPDFVLPIVDFWNAFHKGYDKDLLLSFLYNARNLYDDMDVDIAEYLSYDEYGSDPFNNLVEFLGEGASESCKSEALPPKPWNGKTRKFPSRAALVKKAKELRATEIGNFDDYTKKNKDLFLDKIGFAMDINGNSVARLWWGENDGKYYYSTSRDVLDRTV